MASLATELLSAVLVGVAVEAVATMEVALPQVLLVEVGRVILPMLWNPSLMVYSQAMVML